MASKSYVKAVDDLNSAIKLDPRDAHGYYQRGLAYEADGDFSKAIADYKSALARNRRLTEAHKALARAAGEAKHAKLSRKDDKPQVTDRAVDKPTAADTGVKADQNVPQKDIVLLQAAPKRAEKPEHPTAALPPPKARAAVAKPQRKGARGRAGGRNAGQDRDNRPTETVQKKQTPQPGERKRSASQTVERKSSRHERASHATSSVWTDKHGLPLSAREIQNIKRLMREGDGRGACRSERAPVRYHRAGSNTTFEDIWR
jgi:tetratricopeptide (TPR) repeat protein